MFDACKAEAGVTLLSVSGYRSYGKQSNIYRRKLRRVKGNEAKAQEFVAPPGASEHQLGLAMDVGQKHKIHLERSFADTEGGKWCRENCWRFGFILRYDEPWEEITGYKYEPWHFRYVGKEYAKEIHDADIPLETWLIGHRLRVIRELLQQSPATPTDLKVTDDD
jgi:D-alanyl-D-alanine carboxypeptidase